LGPRILNAPGSQTTKAGSNKPSFSFSEHEMGGSTELEPITEEDRSRVKKELSQSLTAAEAKK
jgi:hypothetical protein